MNKEISEAARWCTNDVAETGRLVQDLWDYMDALADGNEEAAFVASQDFIASAGFQNMEYRMPPGYWELFSPAEQFVMTATQILMDKAAGVKRKFMNAVLYHMSEDAEAKQEEAKEEA